MKSIFHCYVCSRSLNVWGCCELGRVSFYLSSSSSISWETSEATAGSVGKEWGLPCADRYRRSRYLQWSGYFASPALRNSSRSAEGGLFGSFDSSSRHKQVGQATVIAFISTIIISSSSITEEHVSESVYIKVWGGWTQTDLRSSSTPLCFANFNLQTLNMTCFHMIIDDNPLMFHTSLKKVK